MESDETMVVSSGRAAGQPVRASGSVRQAIFEALERRAIKEWRRIRIKDVDGIVTLSGTCQTWAEKMAVVGAVRGTPGVRSVRDELRIAP